jgi:hypothetical protein
VGLAVGYQDSRSAQSTIRLAARLRFSVAGLPAVLFINVFYLPSENRVLSRFTENFEKVEVG